MCFSLGLSCKGFSVLLGLDDFLSNVGEIFNYNFFKNFLSAFLFSSSGTTITWISMRLISSKLTQRLLRLASGLFILFPLFCSSAVIYTILSSSSYIHSSASVISVISSFSVQFSSVTRSCPTLCNPMDCNRPGFPVHHHLLEFTQNHVHWVSDVIKPSHPLSSSSAFNLSQHQGLFQGVSSLHQMAKVLELQL